MRPRCLLIGLFVVAGVGLPPCPVAAWQGQGDGGGSAAKETVTVVAGERYAAGGLHRFLFGDAYRQLWVTPIEVEILDLAHEQGGLTPMRKVGRLQTLGLAMRSADGRSFTFRAIEKDLVRALPPELLDTAIADITQDQMAASLPGGPVVAVAIVRAAGVLEAQPRIVYMPDDPALGEFRNEFGGLLGTFEEFPTPRTQDRPGTFGATEIISGSELFERMNASPEVRPDARAYLRARLVDLLLGDWDRHVGQWRWARIPSEELLQPIVEDRDQAFSRYEGLTMGMVRDREPKFDRLRPTFQPLEGLAWNGRTLDRRFLPGIERKIFEATARDIQQRLTDEVLESAVDRLPAEYVRLAGERLLASLRVRRDGLVAEAGRYYRFLAKQSNLRASNRSEFIIVDRLADGAVEVTLALADPGEQEGCGVQLVQPQGPEPYYRGRFVAGETEALNIYTGGGDDRVLVRGRAAGSMQIRIIGGAGDNVLCDQASGRTLAFDLSTENDPGRGLRVSPGLWIPPSAPLAKTGTPPESQGAASKAVRDWGSTTYRQPWFGIAPDLGLFLGMGIVKETYDFRKHPYAAQHQIRGGFSYGSSRPRFDYIGTFRAENSRRSWTLRALASGIETLNFYGFGNDTEEFTEEEFFRVESQTGGLEARIMFPIGEHGTFSTGPLVRYTGTDTDDDRLIGVTVPYGAEGIGQVGWVAGLSLNTRESPGVRDIKGSDDVLRWGPAPFGVGYSVDVDGYYYPDVWGLKDDYGGVSGVGTAAYWLGSGFGLGFRVGGEKIWGEVPYYDAAFLGATQIRGLRANRFAGTSSLYGNVAALARIGGLTLMVPGRWGILVRADVGRVWVQGEDSDTVHWSYGGGLWWSPWNFSNALRVYFANSDQRTAVYVLMGFGF